jgi:hypothetical protein
MCGNRNELAMATRSSIMLGMTKVWFSDVAHFPSFSTVSGAKRSSPLFRHSQEVHAKI